MADQKKTNRALLLVDIQNDFCSGSLAVPGALEIIPEINKVINYAHQQHMPIIASRDWHPENHCSFAEHGGPWPTHCVAGTEGAAWQPDLAADQINIIVNKACEQNTEQYSAINAQLSNSPQTLLAYLKQQAIKELIVCGLALDYCVYHSVIEAQQNGIQCSVILNCCRHISEATAKRCLDDMQQAGATLHQSFISL